MTQTSHPSPGVVGVYPAQTVCGRIIRVTRRDGGASGERVLVDDTGTEWVAVGTSGSLARLADVQGWQRLGETLAEAASRYPTVSRPTA
jgi:hypothetical protein